MLNFRKNSTLNQAPESRRPLSRVTKQKLLNFSKELPVHLAKTSDTFMDLPYNQENNEDLIEKRCQIRKEKQEISNS